MVVLEGIMALAASLLLVYLFLWLVHRSAWLDRYDDGKPKR